MSNKMINEVEMEASVLNDQDYLLIDQKNQETNDYKTKKVSMATVRNEIVDKSIDIQNKFNDGTINFIAPHGNNARSWWESHSYKVGGIYEVDASWSNITHTGITPINQYSGKSGVGKSYTWSPSGASPAYTEIPFGCSSSAPSNCYSCGYVSIRKL